MVYEQKEGSGALFKNEKKKTEKHPDCRGTIFVGGIEYWVSGWNNMPKSGKAYVSLALQPKDQKAATPERPALMNADPEILPF